MALFDLFDVGSNSVPNEEYGRQQLHAAASISPYSLLSTITPRIVVQIRSGSDMTGSQH